MQQQQDGQDSRQLLGLKACGFYSSGFVSCHKSQKSPQVWQCWHVCSVASSVYSKQTGFLMETKAVQEASKKIENICVGRTVFSF
jgi:hypothetical protein